MTHGVLALGDSIVDGHGMHMQKVPAQGWPQWLADSMGECLMKWSVGGYTSAEVVEHQLPRVSGLYRLGAVSMGANDVLRDWDAERYRENLRSVLGLLAECCEHTAITTMPESIGRGVLIGKERGAHARDASDIIASVAAETGAVVVPLADLAGYPLMRGDQVHPTALGQVEIADRASRALQGQLDVRLPSTISHLWPGPRIEPAHRWRYLRDTARWNARGAAKALLRR